MPFSIEPKSGPSIPTPPGASSHAPTPAAEARQRAIAKLMTPEANPRNDLPLPTPSQVSPEEMSAVVPKSQGETPPVTEPDADPSVVRKDTSEGSKDDPSKEVKDPKADPLSSQYANLARKEKALRAKVQAQETTFRQREEALKAREDALAAKDAEYASKFVSKDKLMADPFSVLAELGFSYDKLTELAMNAPTENDVQTRQQLRDELKAEIMAELKPLKEAQQKQEQEIRDRQQKAYQDAVAQLRNETKSLVESDPEFETIKATGSIDDVVELIEETYKKDKVLLTVQEAAREVEAYLLEEAEKLLSIGKLKSKFSPAPRALVEPQKSVEPQQPQIRTLTNAGSTSRPMSARDRAIAAFNNRNK